MATREFYPNTVAAACAATVAKMEAATAAKHEANIREMMKVPYGGCWPFRKARLRTREECEKHYGEADHVYSRHWWEDREHSGRIRRIGRIRALAEAAGADGRVRLSDEEARLVGVAH